MKIRSTFFFLSLIVSTVISSVNTIAQDEFVTAPIDGVTAMKDIDFVTTTDDVQNQCPQSNLSDVNQNYTPSFKSTYSQLVNIFADLPYGNNRFRSQCFMRAHIWSYMMWRDYGIKSLKIFIFFTNQSKISTGPGWWFHVAPMVMDRDGKAWAMDKQFTDGPLSVDEWIHNFVIKGTNCPIVNNYTAYENNQNSFDCFIRIVPMYYMPPLDIENADKNHRAKAFQWNSGELSTARTHFPFFGRGNINIDRLY